MSQTIYHVDSFTTRPFAGNPAGVCVLPTAPTVEWMQHIARELNLAETAFLVAQADGYDLRWFTPAVEVALCGHATLASAHILWETGALAPEAEARFHTLSGLLTATKLGTGIEMDFPATPAQPVTAPAGLLEALGIHAQYVGKSQFDYLVEAVSEDVVRTMRPDFARLGEYPVRGTIVTSRSAAAEFDFVSRFFAPAVGINEDPVTGSAHCCLGPFWSKRLGRGSLTGYQASARGGVVRVRLAGDHAYLGGEAVTVLRSELL